MPGANVGQVVTAAWQKLFPGEPRDAVYREYDYLRWAEQNAKKVSGGRSIIGNVEYKANTTIKAMASATETLDTTIVDVFDEWEATWKQYSGTFSMTSIEEAINRGDSAKFDLEKGKLQNLRRAMRQRLNEDLIGVAASNEMSGLQDLVPDDPTTGTVQGFNRGTWTFWRSQQASGAKTTSAYDNLRSAMRNMRTACARGQGAKFPTDYWCSDTTSNGYESLLVANERVIGKDDSDANAGFSGEKYLFGKARVRWDDGFADTRMYALNNEDIKLAYLSGFWFKGYEPVRPANQLVKVFAIETQAQYVVTNPRHLGVITAIS